MLEKLEKILVNQLHTTLTTENQVYKELNELKRENYKTCENLKEFDAKSLFKRKKRRKSKKLKIEEVYKI